jgi:hypothetical protein
VLAIIPLLLSSLSMIIQLSTSLLLCKEDVAIREIFGNIVAHGESIRETRGFGLYQVETKYKLTKKIVLENKIIIMIGVKL